MDIYLMQHGVATPAEEDRARPLSAPGRAGVERVARRAAACGVRVGRCVHSGKLRAEQTARAQELLLSMGTPCLIHQPVYSMFNRWIEDGLTNVLEEEGIGCIAFSPLAQGLLTNRYLKEIPADSRAGKSGTFLRPDQVTEDKINRVRQLNQIAQARGQTMAEMAIAWVLRRPVVTSALIGASRVQQIEDVVHGLNNLTFSQEELDQIDRILASQ